MKFLRKWYHRYFPRTAPGEWYWHVHHEFLAETLVQPLFQRIRYIREFKNYWEIPIRLALLTPIKGVVLNPADMGSDRWRDYMEKLHKQEHPKCTWDGHTIFPDGNRTELPKELVPYLDREITL